MRCEQLYSKWEHGKQIGLRQCEQLASVYFGLNGNYVRFCKECAKEFDHYPTISKDEYIVGKIMTS